MMKRSKLLLVAVVATVSWATTALAWSLFDNVTLGAVVQLTGFLAESGRYYRDGYKLAVDRINEKGGVTVAGKQHKLSLKLLDNKSDPKLTQHLYEGLARKDTGLLGPYFSTDVMTAAGVAEKQQVPMIAAGGASNRLISRGYKYVFSVLPVAEENFDSTLDMMAQLDPKPKTIGVVSGDSSVDLTAEPAMLDRLKKAGMELVLQQQYSDRIPNFFNILTLIKSKAPDVLFWSGHEANAISYIREARSRNIHPNLLASFAAGVPAASFRSALGKDANFAFGMTPWLPNERLKDRWFGDANQFVALYQRKFGYAPDFHAAAAVAAVEAYAMALEAAGSLDPKALRDQIAKLDFDSLYGRVHFGEDGQMVIPQTVVQIQNDKLIEVFTDKIINEPIYPIPGWDRRS